MPPPLDGILETAIYVHDIAASADFYQRVLGLTLVDAGERLCALSAGPRQLLLIFRRGASATLPRAPHDASGQQHVAFAIASSALGPWQAWLAACGVEIEETRHWERGGVSLYFRDPDGHLLELATPGVWSVY